MPEEQENDALESLLGETTIIETTDEDGEVHVFEKISEFDFNDQDYALLIYRGTPEEAEKKAEALSENPDAEDEEEEVVVMKITMENGQEVFEAIEDQDEFSRVVSFLETLDDDDIELNVGDVLEQMAEREPNKE